MYSLQHPSNYCNLILVTASACLTRNAYAVYVELYAIVTKHVVKATFARTGFVNKVVETIMLAAKTKLV